MRVCRRNGDETFDATVSNVSAGFLSAGSCGSKACSAFLHRFVFQAPPGAARAGFVCGEWFEWDERKRATNLTKHGVDFELAKLIFEGPTLEGPDDRRNYGERRIGAFGVYTWRGRRRRLISARKAGKHEQKIYASRIAALPAHRKRGARRRIKRISGA